MRKRRKICTALSPYVYPGLFNSASSSSFSFFAQLAIFVVFMLGTLLCSILGNQLDNLRVFWLTCLFYVLFVTYFTEIIYHHHHLTGNLNLSQQSSVRMYKNSHTRRRAKSTHSHGLCLYHHGTGVGKESNVDPFCRVSRRMKRG